MFHYHWSSKEVRRLAGAENEESSFLCPTCCHVSVNSKAKSRGKIHNMSMERLPIIVSSSTLHEHFIENNYTGDEIHIDYVTSPGGTIKALQHMWHIDYNNEKKAMDVLLIAGLNDFRSPNNTLSLIHI